MFIKLIRGFLLSALLFLSACPPMIVSTCEGPVGESCFFDELLPPPEVNEKNDDDTADFSINPDETEGATDTINGTIDLTDLSSETDDNFGYPDELAGPFHYDVYAFYGLEGQNITMTSRTDGFEAFVFIDYVDSDGTIETDIEPLFGNDEAASGQLPFTGNYEIVLAVSDGNFEEYPDLTYTLSWMVEDEDEVD